MDQRRVEDLLGKNAQLELENQSLQEQVSLLSLQLEEERGRNTGKSYQGKLIRVKDRFRLGQGVSYVK